MMQVLQAMVERRAGLRYRASQAFAPVMRATFGGYGAGTVIVAPLALRGVDRIFIGRNVIVRDGAWLATEGDRAEVRIGDNVYVGHRAHIHSIDPVTIGSDCVLADNVMISSTDHDRVDRHAVHGTGAVTIGQDVFVGQNAVILGGVSVGQGATVAAGAVVIADVPPRAVVAGVPARLVGGSQ